jgi:hypothetical protein
LDEAAGTFLSDALAPDPDEAVARALDGAAASEAVGGRGSSGRTRSGARRIGLAEVLDVEVEEERIPDPEGTKRLIGAFAPCGTGPIPVPDSALDEVEGKIVGTDGRTGRVGYSLDGPASALAGGEAGPGGAKAGRAVAYAAGKEEDNSI